MSAEIIAKLGLSDEKFAAGLKNSESRFNNWARKLKATSNEILNGKAVGTSSVDTALRAQAYQAQQAAKTVESTRKKLTLARSPEVATFAQSSVDVALRAQETARKAVAKNPIDPLPAAAAVEKRATGILGLLQRKFSTTDLFKDSLKSIGLGLGVGALAGRVTNFFRIGADDAKRMADHTEAMVDIQRTLAGAMGGPRRELELQVKQVNELNRDIEAQTKLVESLKNTPLQLLSDDYQQQVDEAKAKLNSLIEKQAQLSAGAKAAAHAENLRTEALQRQSVHASNLANIELRHGVEMQKFDERRRALLEEYVALQKQGALPSALQENRNRQVALEKERALFIRNEREKMEDLKRTADLDANLTKAELRDASDLEKKQIRLNALRREYEVIKKRGGTQNDLEANRNEQRALANETKILKRDARRDLTNTLTAIGSSLAGHSPDRVAPLRPRGRSERERIADRGVGLAAQAEEAIRTGKSPEYVARLARASRMDLERVGGKIGQSTSKVAKDDAIALRSELIKANEHLSEIRKNLEVVKL